MGEKKAPAIISVMARAEKASFSFPLHLGGLLLILVYSIATGVSAFTIAKTMPPTTARGDAFRPCSRSQPVTRLSHGHSLHLASPPSPPTIPAQRGAWTVPTSPVAQERQPPRATTVSGCEVVIRSAEWDDLGGASRLLVSEFYGHSMWFPAQCLSELNRLQQNFHFGPSQHAMYVAQDSSDGSIIGYVDVDGREITDPTKKDPPPRPYLSDLAVAKDQRRRGLGTLLVRESEKAAIGFGARHLYLKVQAENPAGVLLYKKLGYSEIRAKDEKNQVLMSKALLE